MEPRRITKDLIIQQTLNNTLQNSKYYAIVANGQMPNNPIILNLIKSAKMIIACDGAALELQNLGIKSDYIVGDNDSFKHENIDNESNYIFIDDQNTNDLTKAFNFTKSNLLPNQEIQILIFASNGNREDHAIANFALLDEYGKIHNNIHMISNYGVFSYLAKEKKHNINCLEKQALSFFSLSEQNIINSQMLEWELVDVSPKNLFSMTLNQSRTNQYSISSTHGLIVYTAFECK